MSSEEKKLLSDPERVGEILAQEMEEKLRRIIRRKLENYGGQPPKVRICFCDKCGHGATPWIEEGSLLHIPGPWFREVHSKTFFDFGKSLSSR